MGFKYEMSEREGKTFLLYKNQRGKVSSELHGFPLPKLLPVSEASSFTVAGQESVYMEPDNAKSTCCHGLCLPGLCLKTVDLHNDTATMTAREEHNSNWHKSVTRYRNFQCLLLP